jgi:hypothetical protein
MASLKDSMTITIGGKPMVVERMRFKQLKIAWPAVRRIADIGLLQFPIDGDGKINAQVDNPMFMEWHAEKIDLMIKVLAAALKRTCPDVTAEVLENMLDLPDTQQLPLWFNELLAISGFEMGNEQGETQAETSPQSSMETGTSSSQSLSPTMSAVETGNVSNPH